MMFRYMIGGLSHNSLICLRNDRRINGASQCQSKNPDNQTNL